MSEQTHQYQKLSKLSKPGDAVFWTNETGTRFFGRLREWRDGEAVIVRTNGREASVPVAE